ncbi:ABC transporter ATP-binding protein [Paucilactobacillus wasatchensis]|uniref:Alkanesulfonates ABC transporter ATP-binding protein / Sulfonate ABC transporter, ATP-binding subunit SsuB n=1 Tax=Paucilactobacillus wasatchensis TaxID=1335616 RepID=A0A0D1A819_9LACO|nr:ABC transporter ATP-binding protein [Paucilactobacillus wasatchensis]KIS02911.1 Alkanesulfonates ABC transporter ATP-binding protein / Sulfonate ABC transporter, ATP-binding subunit SsuB [Paucilactobacillus wasatchensis]
MANPFLTLRNIDKQYNNEQVLRDIDFEIAEDEFVAIVGMSGGGKSTLLRIIAGLEEPSSGTIKFHEHEPVVRFMFQDDRILPWMSVLENLSFKSRDPKSKTRAVEMLNLVGLSEFADYYPSALSGGQRQRVALARALMARPQLLLLDEPLGALDALTRRKMQQLIMQICHEQHLMAVLVTHDVDEAARMADRVIVIRNGTNRFEEVGAKGRDAAAVSEVSDKLFDEIVNTAY